MENVYSPCDKARKRRLWEELKRVKVGTGKGLWCIVEDFNAVTSSKETKGVGNLLGSQEMIEFKNWVNDLELVDPPLLGRKFTWYTGQMGQR